MNRSIVYTLFSIVFLAGSCKEVAPDLTFGPPSGLSDRVVVVEEFTGAQCVFCPPGSEELENLLSLYPENMIAISIHTGFFAMPIPNKSNKWREKESQVLQVSTPVFMQNGTSNEQTGRMQTGLFVIGVTVPAIEIVGWARRFVKDCSAHN